MEVARLDIWEIIWSAGIVVKSVLALLIFASVSSWAIIFKKKSFIKKIRKNNHEFMQLYQSSNELDDVFNKVHTLPFSPNLIMFLSGHKELQQIHASFPVETQTETIVKHYEIFGLGAIKRSLDKGGNMVNIKLERWLSPLASIGSITPFMGLFGTVWGIIDSFTGLATGGATLDAVAPGIAEALVATAVGLAAAMPAVWFYNSFSNENLKLNTEMESFEQDFLNRVERSLVQIGA